VRRAPLVLAIIELKLMPKIKAMFDPRGILNPGKVL
jgi:FAD/FMN-containing dehydrogenase